MTTLYADRRANTLLIVPNNDAEAAMIIRLARKLRLALLVSRQPHGARLEKEPRLLSRVKAAGKPRVVVVEMPGPVIERKLKRTVTDFVWIDHHQYDFLDRAHDPRTRRPKPSSLEQFLEFFGVTDAELKKWGWVPKIIKGVGVSDRAFIWGLQKEGYTTAEVKKTLRLIDQLERTAVRQPGVPPRATVVAAARRAWRGRKLWHGFYLVHSPSKFGIRGELSGVLAATYGKPTPVILVERGGNRLYVQESILAGKLFKVLGGFTFGGVHNWGYDNTMFKPRRTLAEVQAALLKLGLK